MNRRLLPAHLDPDLRAGLPERAKAALARLAACDLCPRLCKVDRLKGETGFCQTGREALVSSHSLHFGEESPLVGRGGSGTIFFAGCNLACVFCQNHDISQELVDARPLSPHGLASLMLDLQAHGAENINFVSPSHVAAQILEALPIAQAGGLDLPLVWNSGGYDLPETLALFDGVIDVYMPDLKFWDPKVAERLVGAADYPERAREAVKIMHRQVGDLVLDEDGRAVHGLMVRHLVMPGDLASTEHWADFLTVEISQHVYLNVMDQYRPRHNACDHPDIARTISKAEYDAALKAAKRAGLTRLHSKQPSNFFNLLRLFDHDSF